MSGAVLCGHLPVYLGCSSLVPLCFPPPMSSPMHPWAGPGAHPLVSPRPGGRSIALTVAYDTSSCALWPSNGPILISSPENRRWFAEGQRSTSRPAGVLPHQALLAWPGGSHPPAILYAPLRLPASCLTLPPHAVSSVWRRVFCPFPLVCPSMPSKTF